MRSVDKQVVDNLRHMSIGPKIAAYSDELVADVYWHWAESTDYNDYNKLVEWIEGEYEERNK